MVNVYKDKFIHQTKVMDAVHPRMQNDATISPEIDRLKIVYDLFTLKPAYQNKNSLYKVNMIFLHGSGMNRHIWEYYLPNLLVDKNDHITLNKVINMDQVTHGDSAVINDGKLGVGYVWTDGARDACKIAEHEFLETNINEKAIYVNIVVGHSMGGHQALFCGILNPYLFDLIFCIEPVVLQPTISNDKGYTKVNPSFFRALNSRIKDTFENEQEYEQFIRTKSFFNNTKPEILDMFIETEKMLLPDGTVKKKMRREQEMLCYLTLHPGATWLIENLHNIKVPVIAINGEIAKWAPKENFEILKQKIPNFEEIIVEKGDHLLNIELPDTVIKHLNEMTKKHILTKTHQENRVLKNLSKEERNKIFEKNFQTLLNERVGKGKVTLAKF
ncbi:hypothetical protein TPHA_0E00280 [Tetrapisispora phaffii CBS 4417]|uniref:AB hydrolase-1 domain-containing protein n=1 Tax=Tetrapisispora phaffii (strain ATCC 24235 / CBS 4417 / NBRC 1672 / NRRL Y-8282 / UCD 70-5) TaxID=1071381 RepID=G8BT96_TETPH|nr:hypothetical protein TPHA_0E00280 [Tetrapisispora phaffii CBS 4417]CCE63124.1 hypothetical protein TPHA_0E00280 [Tetrapisispora phaffii CBS 4417]